jgi:Ca2+-binding RTX toxin-like protein
LFAGIGGPGALNSNYFKLSSQTLDSDDRIIYNQQTGALFYDADGSGAGEAIQFAQLQANTLLNSS